MKFFSLLIFFSATFFSISSVAQTKIWLDTNWQVTSKEKAVYYKLKVANTSEKQLITAYYLSGKKVNETYYIAGKPDGKYAEYYATGELKTLGKFENGLKDGTWKTYYKKGKIKEKGRYK
ncbi:MAG: toxin-antitoxin system YwqK family antitoxin, partial [Polaribacter sp.]